MAGMTVFSPDSLQEQIHGAELGYQKVKVNVQ